MHQNRLAHRKVIRVVSLVGPSSILLALMASGFNGQRFTFLGYLPSEKAARVQKLKEIEKASQPKASSANPSAPGALQRCWPDIWSSRTENT